jgi:hypothetical protein
MDAGIVALVGLGTTALTALGVPFVQAWNATKTAAQGKLYEQRLAAYVDAMIFVRYVEMRVENLTEEPDLRTSSRDMIVSHEDSISALLRLVAPIEVLQPWTELLEAWRVLTWNLNQDGPQDHYGEHVFYASADRADVKRVVAAVEKVGRALRAAMGIVE